MRKEKAVADCREINFYNRVHVIINLIKKFAELALNLTFDN